MDKPDAPTTQLTRDEIATALRLGLLTVPEARDCFIAVGYGFNDACIAVGCATNQASYAVQAGVTGAGHALPNR